MRTWSKKNHRVNAFVALEAAAKAQAEINEIIKGHCMAFFVKQRDEASDRLDKCPKHCSPGMGSETPVTK
jgi:hypothetical protein